MLLTPDQARKLADALLGDVDPGDDDGFETPDFRRFPDGAFGRYKVTRLVGMGGMGEVYEAEQESPRRRVAIKVLRPELISPDLLRRFDHEARVLGRLQHPGIAQIFEAGRATTGAGATPFFAMEFVEGKPLTAWAVDQKLDLKARLELFLKACEAVEHAHRHGIIHRDLKPGNILVGDDGRPRVLDFGVARATDADIRATTVHTEVGRLVGTLPYMSPEQVSGDPDSVDTRSDVYSLGIVLYELLAGKPPYEIKRGPIFDAAKVIRETDAAPLSTVDRALRGDVETIVAKALEKDPARRYQSVSDLAADIRRFLRNEPITARRLGVWYATRKLYQRHRSFVVMIVLTGLALAVATAVSVAFAVREARSRADAESLGRRESSLRKLADDKIAELERTGDNLRALVGFTNDVINMGMPSKSGGKELSIRDALAMASESVDDRFRDRPALRAMIKTMLGQTYRDQGDIARAEQFLRSAAELSVASLGENHTQTATTLLALANVLVDKNELEEALSLATRSNESRKAAEGADAVGTVRALNTIGNIQLQRRNLDEAEEAWREALERSARLQGEDHPETLQLRRMTGVLLLQRGRPDQAAPLLLDTWQGLERSVGPDDPATLNVMSDYGVALTRTGRSNEALTVARDACARAERIFGPTHSRTLIQLSNMAGVLADLHQGEEAESVYRRVIDALEASHSRGHPDTLTAKKGLASLYVDQKRYADAEAILRDIVPQGDQAFPKTLAPPNWRTEWGRCLTELGRFEEAESLLLAKDSAFGPRKTAALRNSYASRLKNLVALYERWDKPSRAAEYRVLYEAAKQEATTGRPPDAPAVAAPAPSPNKPESQSGPPPAATGPR